MKKIIINFLFLLLSVVSIAQPHNKSSEPKKLTRILFIFDASTSMMERWDGDYKINRSKQLMVELLDSLETIQKSENLEVALRIYGHQSPDQLYDCFDSKLEVPFSPNSISDVREKIRNVKAKGTTPIAYSLGQSQYDFPECSDCRNIIILITDGIEMCKGNPCEVSLELQRKGVVLKPYIIGVDIDISQVDMLNCIGNYYNAANSQEFRQAINTIVGQVTNLTSVQVNLLDTYGKPTETNAAMSFHDNQSGKVRYTYMHTLNKSGNPDTIYLDILSVYDLKVHTIPPVYLDSIKLKEGVLNIIEVPAPQGTLWVNIGNDTAYNSEIKVLLKKSGQPQHNIYILDADKKQKVLTGLYDLEILTMPRTYFYAVQIEQSKTKKLDIPAPGTVIFNFRNPCYASLLHDEGNVLTNLFDITPDQSHYKFKLQPGYYRLIIREKQHFSSAKTVEYKFRVKSGDFIVENF
ncbi:MAG TPA: VWA domain-containing protein [Bacteroidales bacterium]|nr:VWA domain-containing protein [Bacteroidales bacterium]HOL98274.1 VWA domain-containing protein [Bacteroidales bacterium]HOM37374.1 VWA domain-containing protein [Bacteroidales bacterium]HPD24092.1 VWA domain-containing protein [Bacteroidales bacterium]HRT00042.1 VWA domain-containing protein [Bacteroidales bacterium]